MARESNAPEREQSTPKSAPDAKSFPSGNAAEAAAVVMSAAKDVIPIAPGSEAKVAEVIANAAAAVVAQTAAPEVEARADFEAEGPEFDPLPAAEPAPVAPPAPEAIPVAPKAASAPQTGLAPPSTDEYDRMLARRVERGDFDDKPHPSTIPVALRPTPQGPHYPAKG